MLPSMYSPVESEAFPPDVCFSGEAGASSSPPAWEKTVCESQGTESKSDIEEAQDSLQLCQSEAVDQRNDAPEDSLEGAVGGELPDLCNTGSSVIAQLVIETPKEVLSSHRHVFNSFETKQYSGQVSDISDNHEFASSKNSSNQEMLSLDNSDDVVVDKKFESQEDCSDNISIKSGSSSNHYKHISFVPCGMADVEKQFENVVDNLSDACSESQVGACCDMPGALEEERKNLQKYGRDLVRENVLQSSHPLYYEWKCSAVIPNYLLTPVSLHSHGTSLGYEIVPSLVLGLPPGSRTGAGDDSHPGSEEEQVKIAKRFGLIRHLPCGVFDGSTKTRECVICMIDFSVGDRVRYLPCMHTYHTHCIDDWLIRSFTCPSCLEPVDAALLSTYETN